MPLSSEDYREPLARAAQHSRDWLDSLATRPVKPREGIEQLEAALESDLPDGPSDPTAVIDELGRLAEPGLMAIGSGRFFGWVMGGTLAAALACDWMVSTWDRNNGLPHSTINRITVLLLMM